MTLESLFTIVKIGHSVSNEHFTLMSSYIVFDELLRFYCIFKVLDNLSWFYWPVWPDLAKFCHFGNILKVFGQFLRGLLICTMVGLNITMTTSYQLVLQHWQLLQIIDYYDICSLHHNNTLTLSPSCLTLSHEIENHLQLMYHRRRRRRHLPKITSSSLTWSEAKWGETFSIEMFILLRPSRRRSFTRGEESNSEWWN